MHTGMIIMLLPKCTDAPMPEFPFMTQVDMPKGSYSLAPSALRTLPLLSTTVRHVKLSGSQCYHSWKPG